MRMESIIGGDAAGMTQVDQLARACVVWAAELERLNIATADEIGADPLAARIHEDVGRFRQRRGPPGGHRRVGPLGMIR